MVWRNQTILTKSIASSKLQLKLPMGQKNFRRWDKRSVGVSTPKCTCLTLMLTCRAAARILYQGDLKSDGREPMAGCTLSLIIIIMIMDLKSVSVLKDVIGYPKLIQRYSLSNNQVLQMMQIISGEGV